ncbi:hypothetical protein CYMTET_26948 [Cymbomonas tetramitiformis]|uniref:beta-N-acetylhexosaminidase n=1 Tax=Cymbomonas tetramitiformis TaxID=36881 RepID=A0AAE0FQQ3_9CHLO|nr:hypothetical protein CYMTET_26948 [Cymbomonas tetramitiformis]
MSLRGSQPRPTRIVETLEKRPPSSTASVTKLNESIKLTEKYAVVAPQKKRSFGVGRTFRLIGIAIGLWSLGRVVWELGSSPRAAWRSSTALDPVHTKPTSRVHEEPNEPSLRTAIHPPASPPPLDRGLQAPPPPHDIFPQNSRCSLPLPPESRAAASPTPSQLPSIWPLPGCLDAGTESLPVGQLRLVMGPREKMWPGPALTASFLSSVLFKQHPPTATCLHRTSILGPVAYIEVHTGGRVGVIHALQTLFQLVVNNANDGTSLPCPLIHGAPLQIADGPRWPYRGLLVDSARQGHSIVFLKQVVEVLSFLKMSYLHWHVTDDQSFALPVKALPDRLSPSQYTIAEVQELVQHCSLYGIKLLPEIDMPGHAHSWQPYVARCPERALTRGHWGAPLNFAHSNLSEVVRAVLQEVLLLLARLPPFWCLSASRLLHRSGRTGHVLWGTLTKVHPSALRVKPSLWVWLISAPPHPV